MDISIDGVEGFLIKGKELENLLFGNSLLGYTLHGTSYQPTLNTVGFWVQYFSEDMEVYDDVRGYVGKYGIENDYYHVYRDAFAAMNLGREGLRTELQIYELPWGYCFYERKGVDQDFITHAANIVEKGDLTNLSSQDVVTKVRAEHKKRPIGSTWIRM